MSKIKWILTLAVGGMFFIPAIQASADQPSSSPHQQANSLGQSRILLTATTDERMRDPIPDQDRRQSAGHQAVQTQQQQRQQLDPRLDRGLDWAQCPQPGGFQLQPISYAPAGVIAIDADSATLERNNGWMRFSGNVVVSETSQRIQAEQADYDSNNQNIDASGQVLFEQQTLRVAASRASFNLKEKRGSASDVEYRLLPRAARGYAHSLKIADSATAHLTEISYTTCAPGHQEWMLKAKKMTLDQESGVGSARNVTLSFMGVPFLYTPYISFPINDQRKSGFLVPRIGIDSKNGLDLSVPYYFNLAPNYDLTFTPRLMTNRGLLLGSEFRYLLDNHRGEINLELLPNDSEHNIPGESTRGAFQLKATGQPALRWRYAIDFNYLSDDTYLDDLGESLETTSVKHIERRGDLHYQGDSWNLLARVQKFQTIDQSIAEANRPYSRLPQLLYNYHARNRNLGLDYGLRSEYVYFNKDAAVHGSRLDIQPTVALPLERSWGFLKPALSLRHTLYVLTDQTVGYDNNLARTTSSFSLDSGLYFERQSRWLGGAVTQTLEPRLYYLNTPYRDQQQIPDFDTAELDFSFANLFRNNRFSGADRIGDANQLTAALTTRSLSNKSGEELFHASLGEIFYFKDRQVQLDSLTPETTGTSAIVAEVGAAIGEHWRGRAGIQWNPHNNEQQREKSGFSLQYRHGDEHIINLAYRQTTGVLEQTDLSLRWPITRRLRGVARWNYSLKYDQTLESFAGIEYDNCCWRARLVGRQYRTAADTELVSALFLQLELKGLTSIGDRVDQFLKRGILGYTAD